MASLLRLLPAPYPSSTLADWAATSASAPTHPPTDAWRRPSSSFAAPYPSAQFPLENPQRRPSSCGSNPYPPLGRKPRPAMLLIPDFSSSFPTPVLVARNPIAVAPPPPIPHPPAAAAAAATGAIAPSATATTAAAAVAAAVPPVSVPFRSCHIASAAPQAQLLPQPIVRASRREFSGISAAWLSSSSSAFSSSSRAPPLAAPSFSVGDPIVPGWLHGATNPTAAAAGSAAGGGGAAAAPRDASNTLWQSSGVSSHHQMYNRQQQQQQQQQQLQFQQHQHRLQQLHIGAVTASSYEAVAGPLNGSTSRRSNSCSRQQQQNQQQEQYLQQPVVVQLISRDATAAPPSSGVPHSHLLLQRQQHQHHHHHHNHRRTSSFSADEGLGLLCGVPQTCFVLGSIVVALFSDAC